MSITKYQLLPLWIFVFISIDTTNAQTLLHPSRDQLRSLCLGDIVNLTCETRGSSIIAWQSDDYIEAGGTQLRFATFNSIGDTHSSPVHPNTVATLISKTNEMEDVTFVSQLQINVSSASSSVTCIRVDSSTTNPIAIETLEAADSPPEIIYEQERAMNGCKVHLSWSTPNNILPEDIKHYINYADDVNHMNTTSRDSTNLTMASYVVCDCAVHNASISTVNRCGVEGQRSTVTIELESDSKSTLGTCDSTAATVTDSQPSYSIESSTSDHASLIAVTVTLVALFFILLPTLIIVTLVIVNRKVHVIEKNE